MALINDPDLWDNPHDRLVLEVFWDTLAKHYYLECKAAEEGKGHLALTAGQVVAITRREEHGWGRGVAHGKEGIFPYNYVKEFTQEELAKSQRALVLPQCLHAAVLCRDPIHVTGLLAGTAVRGPGIAGVWRGAGIQHAAPVRYPVREHYAGAGDHRDSAPSGWHADRVSAALGSG